MSVACIEPGLPLRPPWRLQLVFNPLFSVIVHGHILWQYQRCFVCSSCLNNATWLSWYCCYCYCLVGSAWWVFTCRCHSNWCRAVLAPPMFQLLGHTTKSAFPKWPRATHMPHNHTYAYVHIHGNTHTRAFCGAYVRGWLLASLRSSRQPYNASKHPNITVHV